MNSQQAVPLYTKAAFLLRKKCSNEFCPEQEKALRNIRKALAIDSKYVPAMYEFAMLNYDMAIMKEEPVYLDQALMICNQAVRLDPDYGPIYNAMGAIHLEKNDIVKAAEGFKKALKVDPSLFSAQMNLGAIYNNTYNYEGALKAFEKAVELRPESKDAQDALKVINSAD